MGYCMRMTECDFFVAAKDKEAALRLVKDATGTFFDMWGSVDAANNASTMEEFLEEARWKYTLDGDQNIVGVEFQGEKLGDDEHFFNAMAPHVKSGSYIQMHGEDGDVWRWVFNGETCVCVYPKVTWGTEEPEGPAFTGKQILIPDGSLPPPPGFSFVPGNDFSSVDVSGLRIWIGGAEAIRWNSSPAHAEDEECEKAQNLTKGTRCGQCAPCRRRWARMERTNG